MASLIISCCVPNLSIKQPMASTSTVAIIITMIKSATIMSRLHIQEGNTALYGASWKGHDQIVEMLLRREADVNHQKKVRMFHVEVKSGCDTCAFFRL